MNKLIITLFTIIFVNSLCLSEEIIFDKSHSPYHIKDDLIIKDTDIMKVAAGAVLIIYPNVNIIVNGGLQVNGLNDDFACLVPETPEIGWGKIELNNVDDTCLLRNVEIIDGSILSVGCNLVMSHVMFTNNQDLPWTNPIVFVRNASVCATNCSVFGSNRGEGFQMLNSKNVSVKNCYFEYIPDAIELTNINEGQLSLNTIIDCPDDGIDLNHCSNIIIDSNYIQQSEDRGIEIGSENNGSSSNIILKNNVFNENNIGVIFKENSSGTIINNTFYNNNVSIKCIEDNTSKNTSCTIKNCIFSNSNEIDIESDANSIIDVAYCISDNFTLIGESNYKGNPLFIAPNQNNFHLLENSPCINTGDPTLNPDPDNTRSDIGAFYFNTDTTSIPLNEQTNIICSIFPNPFKKTFFIDTNIESTVNKIDLYGINGEKIDFTYSLHSSSLNTNRYAISLKNTPNATNIIICTVKSLNKTNTRVIINNPRK